MYKCVWRNKLKHIPSEGEGMAGTTSVKKTEASSGSESTMCRLAFSIEAAKSLRATKPTKYWDSSETTTGREKVARMHYGMKLYENDAFNL